MGSGTDFGESSKRTLARSAGIAIALCTSFFSVILAARADSPPPKDLSWDPAWSKFRASEYVTTGVMGTASLLAFFALKAPSKPRWTGGTVFDNGARHALRLRAPGARDAARKLSDIGALSTITLKVGVESIIVPTARGHSEVAWQLAMMDAEALALSTLVHDDVHGDRPRPSLIRRLSTKSPIRSPVQLRIDCIIPERAQQCGVYGGRAVMRAPRPPFTYGDKFAHAFACGLSLTLATATSTLRILGDRHYASDVLVGAGIGFGSGYGMPTLLHYGTRGEADEATAQLGTVTTGERYALT